MSGHDLRERLAQEIRRVDGAHELGAGQLAEALMPFLTANLAPPEAVAPAGESARYFASGPDGSFFTDDLRFASHLVDYIDSDDDWTITDLHNPLGTTPPAQVAVTDALLDVGSYTLCPTANLERIVEALEFANTHPRLASDIRGMIAVSGELMDSAKAALTAAPEDNEQGERK